MPEVLTAAGAWAHWDAMVAAAYGVLQSQDDAVECAAQALVQVLEHPPAGVASPEAYLVTIAKRRALDRVRHRVSERRAVARLSAADSGAAAPDVAEAVCARAEAQWVDRYARERLEPAVYALLRHLGDGLSVAEAAAATGMTFKAAEGHLSRSRKLLRGAAARALGALLAVLGALRRPAVSTAVVAAAAMTVIGLPGTRSPQPAPTPQTQPLPRASVDSPHPSVRLPRTAPTGRAARQVTPAAVPGRGTPVVRSPALEVGTYRREDGYRPTGPVDRVQHCLDTLVVSLQELSCR